MLRALAELPHVQARIVGGQPGETDHVRLDALARELGVHDRVTFTGWLPPASVVVELARANALMLPNTPTHTSERYTSPLKLFEYLAAGRPIIASDLAALREILRHDDTALLVEAGLPAVAGCRGFAGSWATGRWRRACPGAPSTTRRTTGGRRARSESTSCSMRRARSHDLRRAAAVGPLPRLPRPRSPTAPTR